MMFYVYIIQRFLHNSKILELIDLIFPCELDMKDTTESKTSASHLDCYLCIDNGNLVTRIASEHLYVKLLFTWLSLQVSMIVSFCAVPFSHEMSWIRSLTYLSQFLRVTLPTLL